MIEAGAAAPDFSLSDQDGATVSLKDLEGQYSVLVFFPAAFSPVCTDQLSVYEEVLPDLRARNAALYGVSVDALVEQMQADVREAERICAATSY